jgi:lactate 2-monooxygenase
MSEHPEEPQAPIFANFQYEIYGRGLAGETPAISASISELEELTHQKLSPEAYGYVSGGAGSELTIAANRLAFERVEILPRMLNDVSVRDLKTEILGTPMPAPLLLAPVGVQSIVHPEGELASARAAAAHGVPVILSTASSHTIEDVAREMGQASRWYQLYWPKDRELALSFVERATTSDYEVLVVTLDTTMLGWRPRDLNLAYLPFLKGEGIANYLSDPVFQAALPAGSDSDPGIAIGHWAYQFTNPSLSWDDLRWLREQTDMPIVLKGILHPEDARRAEQEGADGVIVSNHGGRQVDGAIASLRALPAIREVVGERFPVLLDGGIRSGSDVIKALSLGADAVCIGRPFIWGLALDGQAGVEYVLRCLLAEIDLTLALSGYSTIDELSAQSVSLLPG